jgi:putative flavoprotein involved in K+ transport
VSFADGTDVTVDGVVWATGFRLDHSLVDLPVFDDGGHVGHRRGVTEVPGLYVQHIAQRIGAFAQARSPARAA